MATQQVPYCPFCNAVGATPQVLVPMEPCKTKDGAVDLHCSRCGYVERREQEDK